MREIIFSRKLHFCAILNFLLPIQTQGLDTVHTVSRIVTCCNRIWRIRKHCRKKKKKHLRGERLHIKHSKADSWNSYISDNDQKDSKDSRFRDRGFACFLLDIAASHRWLGSSNKSATTIQSHFTLFLAIWSIYALETSHTVPKRRQFCFEMRTVDKNCVNTIRNDNFARIRIKKPCSITRES